MTSHVAPSDADKAVSAAVRALAAGRGITHARVAAGIQLANATFARRLMQGGWTVTELVRLADYFDIPAESLITGLDGKVKPATGPVIGPNGSLFSSGPNS